MILNDPPPVALSPQIGVSSYRKKILQYSLSLALLTGVMPAVAGVMADEFPDIFPEVAPVVMTFTDSASFNAALPGTPLVTTFDNTDAETIIPNGSQFGNINFSLNSGSDLIVTDNFDTTSPFNYLGADDGFANEFLSGDELLFNFDRLVQAFGLFVIGSPEPENILPFDLQLVGGGLNVFNDTPEFTLDDGGDVFFLGIINENGFDSARLNSFGDPNASEPFFAFNIDDISTFSEVPEPGTLLLMAFGFALLIRRSRRFSSKSQSNSEPSTGLLFKSVHQISKPSRHFFNPSIH